MSARPTTLDRPRHDRRCSGFTLMEIMATVAVVGIVVGMLLTIRESSTNVAFRAHHMMEAMRLAEHHIARWALEPEDLKDAEGRFEEDRLGIYRWKMTIEEFDLSTGRPVEDEDDGLSSGVANNYSDAVPADEVEDEDDPYTVRRLVMTVYYPSPEGEDKFEEILLETYLPMLDLDEDDQL